MSRFEYLSVLISIVIALGVTEITVSWGRILQNRKTVRFYWLHAFWSVFMLFLMIQFWWGFWNYRTVSEWSFLNLITTVMQAMTLVLCALLFTPARTDIERANLRELYFENARVYFVLGAVLMLQFIRTDVFEIGIPIGHPENLVRLAGAGTAIILAVSLRPRLHETMALVCAGLLSVFLLTTVMV